MFEEGIYLADEYTIAVGSEYSGKISDIGSPEFEALEMDGLTKYAIKSVAKMVLTYKFEGGRWSSSLNAGKNFMNSAQYKVEKNDIILFDNHMVPVNKDDINLYLKDGKLEQSYNGNMFITYKKI